MNNIFFTSDTHFYHDNIIKFCNRPADNIEQHNDFLISNWNNIVGKRDVVWHLGDFAMLTKKNSPNNCVMKGYRKIIGRLNGKINLILGNHDKMSRETYNCFSQVYDFGKTININKETITLCHFPLRAWNKSMYGSFHLFGHVHGRLEYTNTRTSCDVGVDVPDWKYAPVPWDIIRCKLINKLNKNDKNNI